MLILSSGEGISESVDSICRDSADTQYMLIQTNFSKSPKELTYKPFVNRVFSRRKTPSGAKKLRESTEPESHQTAKMFFFRRASSNLRDAFSMVFVQNSSIFHWAVHQPIAFFQVWSHRRRFEPLTEELWLPLRRHFFLHEYACAQIT